MDHHRRALRTIAGLLALGVLKAASSDDPDEVLKQASAKVRANADHARNYTCVETVERGYYHPPLPVRPGPSTAPRGCKAVLEERLHPTPSQELQLFSTDRLRLDVTVAKEGEIFSWAGASRFDSAIDMLVREGPISTGPFDAALDMIFATDVPQFHFEGKQVVDGSELMEYSFQVDQSGSHYLQKRGNSMVKTAYQGSLSVKPATGDVVRLRLETTDLRAANGSCHTVLTLDYGATEIGSASFQLPTNSRERFIYPNGNEAENTTTFASCREYRGDSTVTYDPPAATLAGASGKSAPAKPAGKIREIAAGLPFTLELLDPIDTDTAAAGDYFRAELAQPLLDKKMRMLAPAGSIVEGRLRRVQSLVRAWWVLVVFAPRSLQIGDERVPFAATRDWSQEVRKSQAGKNPSNLPMMILLPLPGEAPAGVFQFQGEHAVVPRGFRSNWMTVAARLSR